jgi:hypothetical protein
LIYRREEPWMIYLKALISELINVHNTTEQTKMSTKRAQKNSALTSQESCWSLMLLSIFSIFLQISIHKWFQTPF